MELTLVEIEAIACGKKTVEITPEEYEAVDNAYSFLDGFRRGKVIYGINTGFGPMAQYHIADSDLNDLQYNIIRSHSCGAGAPICREAVRLAMLSRLRAFLCGRSGVHRDVVDALRNFLNNDITPVVPEHGSVGASGDLVQLSHIALALIGEGEVFFGGKRMTSAEAIAQCGLKPLKLHIRDGLALTNGTGMMTGLGFMNLIAARRLFHFAVTTSVMINEIVRSFDDFMAEELNALKNHAGQSEVARMMREMSASSRLLMHREAELYNEHKNGEKVFDHKVQPYYSLRCTPQILGPVLEVLDNTEKILMEELYSADDNPIVDPVAKNVFHGGNFHGDYISFEMDKLKIAVTKMTMLAERQLNYIFHDRINGILPPFVNLGKLGLNYGLQAAQFTATSTTAECQTLSNPMYVHSIPNNNDNQDVVSMGTNSALLAHRVVENSFQVFSIHLMALVQAVDCLNERDNLSDATRTLYDEVRNLVPVFREDTTKYAEIERLIDYMKR